LGLGIAGMLAEQGYRAIAIARKESPELRALMQENGEPGCVQFAPFDLADLEGIAGLVKTLRKEFGPFYSLAHCVNVASPKNLIAASEFAGQLTAAVPELSSPPTIWIYANEPSSWPRLDLEIETKAGDPLSEHEKQPPAKGDPDARFV
jgi:NAD(P)-dependent dehydrogenase (short-subunit alcohol dehydrogenase family)